MHTFYSPNNSSNYTIFQQNLWQPLQFDEFFRGKKSAYRTKDSVERHSNLVLEYGVVDNVTEIRFKIDFEEIIFKKNFPYTMKKNKTSFNHSVRGTWGVFWPSFIVVTKPSAEMKRKAHNVTTLPHPGSTLTSNSRKITALQQDKNVTNKVGIILCLAWHCHFCLMFTLFWQTSISREKLSPLFTFF